MATPATSQDITKLCDTITRCTEALIVASVGSAEEALEHLGATVVMLKIQPIDCLHPATDGDASDGAGGGEQAAGADAEASATEGRNSAG